MKKITNLLMVMCLAVAALTLTFAVCLPNGSKQTGASVAPASVTSSAVNFETAAEFDAARPAFASVNYFTSDADFYRGAAFGRQPVIAKQFAVDERSRRLPKYNFAVKRSLFDTPLFKNKQALKPPAIFVQPQIRNSPLRR